MQLKVLGSLEVVRGDAALRPHGTQQRRLLAALALAPNRVVSTGRLMVALWGDTPPPSARTSLRAHVSRLRDALRDDGGMIVTRADGYMLRVAPDDTDAARFEQLTQRARHVGEADPDRALALLDEALALWRGPAFAEVAAEPLVRPDAVRLEELRRNAMEDRFELLLACGRHEEIIPGLEAFAWRHPLRERPHRQLMLALYRSGRQADALALHRDLRARLADELGLRPSAALQALERAILRQDVRLDAPGARTAVPEVTASEGGSSAPDVVRTGAGHLVERDPELALLNELLADVTTAHQGRLAVVHGEAGIGKSALLRRFCHDRSQTRVLWGSCDPLFTPRPLGPFRDIAGDVGGAVRDAVSAAGRPYEVAGAVGEELRRAAPSVLVLEDLQWADEATLDVVRLLARRVRSLPALISVSYRDDELADGHPLRRVLGEVATLPGTTHVPLRPLSPAAVTALAAPAGRAGTLIHAMTGGNPLFVTEVLAAESDEVPETVLHAVLGRAGDLDGAARAVLEIIAVTPPRMEPWLLEAVAGDARGGLDACLASGLVVCGPAGVAFRHELARRAVESTIPPHRRQQLHRRVLDALAEAPDDIDDLPRLAHHADGAGDIDAVLDVGHGAARHAAEVGANREAAAYYARVLRHGDRLEPRMRAAVLEQYARACVLADDSGAATTAMEQAVQIRRRTGDRRAEANALRLLARVLWGPGRTIEAAALARQAVRMLEDHPDTRELGCAYADAGWLALSAGDTDSAMAWSARARGVAAAVGDVRIDVEAATTLAAIAGLGGDPDAHVAFARCRQAAEDAGLDEHVGRVLLTEAVCSLRRGEYGDASRAAARAEEVCHSYGHELTLSYVQAYQSVIALDLGQWPRAGELAATVLRHPRSATLPRILALTVGALRAVRTGDGDPTPALDEADQLAAPTGELERLVPPALARAEIAWLRGRRDDVVRATDGVHRLAAECRAGWVLGPLAGWRLRVGAPCDLPADVVTPYRLQASERHVEAARWWQARGCGYQAALSLVDDGGDEEVTRAVATLRALDAVTVVDRVVPRDAARVGRSRSVREHGGAEPAVPEVGDEHGADSPEHRDRDHEIADHRDPSGQ